MARNSVNPDDTVDNGDNLDQLLVGFKSRNEYRADPNYVLEPVDFTTTIPERFVKILRDSSLSFPDMEDPEEVLEPETEPETNSGLILLAENYDKNARKKLLRGRVFGILAGVILFVAVITFSAFAGNILAGIAVAVIAGVFIVMSRNSTAQAHEIHQIAAALTKPEETS
ncbi:MAG: phage holin family protein [Rhodoluna sp.]